MSTTTSTAAVQKKSTKAAKPTHPTYAEMIKDAVNALSDRKGSSKQAINKHILSNYNVAKTSPHLKMALKKLVTKGTLKQVKGVGASGSFKLGEQPKAPKPKKVAKPKKTVKPAKKKTSTVASKGKKVKPAKKAASPSKKKTGKSPGKKASVKRSTKKSVKTATKSKKPVAKKAGVKKPTPKKPAKKAAKAK